MQTKLVNYLKIDEGYEIFDFLMEFVLHTFKNMEAGFVESSIKVNECVKRFFEKNNNDDLNKIGGN